MQSKKEVIFLKKILKLAFLFFIVLSLCFPISARADSWSIKREKDNKQPILEPDFSYITEFNGYYLDTHADESDKVIYLTFDAGYENGNISRILDTLKKHDAKAAFFVLSHLVTANTDLVKRMAEDGHFVCNHTAKHPDMTKYTDFQSFKKELVDMEKIYKDTIGLDIKKYYRPPEGKFNKQNLEFAESLGYKTIFWSFAYADWDNNKQPSKDYAIKKIKDNTHNGMVVLLHPTSKTNADILDTILTYWENEGYRFGTLDELTREKS